VRQTVNSQTHFAAERAAMAQIDTTFFCGLDQISLPMTTRRGERFLETYYLTRDQCRIVELVSEFRDALGSVEVAYLRNRANAVIYRNGSLECPSASEEHVSKALEKQLTDDMLAIKSLEMALWMIKDNACHFDRCWIAGTLNGRTIVSNNVWASRFSCADGFHRDVSFSSDELRTARRSCRPLAMHLEEIDAPTALIKTMLRFQRFEYFVGAARATNDVAVKIAQYCSGLEALVSTSQQELSHQVSERVASVLVEPGLKRIATFKLVKTAYGFRSKCVHGASFKPAEFDQLRDCSTQIDEVCRALQALYLDTDQSFRSAVEGPDQNFSEFFMGVVLGTRAAIDCLDVKLLA
jgi:hypothetical protein